MSTTVKNDSQLISSLKTSVQKLDAPCPQNFRFTSTSLVRTETP